MKLAALMIAASLATFALAGYAIASGSLLAAFLIWPVAAILFERGVKRTVQAIRNDPPA
jgi:hypothetical protein